MSEITSYRQRIHGVHSGGLELGLPAELVANAAETPQDQDFKAKDNEGPPHHES